jgi:hypothetical protein
MNELNKVKAWFENTFSSPKLTSLGAGESTDKLNTLLFEQERKLKNSFNLTVGIYGLLATTTIIYAIVVPSQLSAGLKPEPVSRMVLDMINKNRPSNADLLMLAENQVNATIDNSLKTLEAKLPTMQQDSLAKIDAFYGESAKEFQQQVFGELTKTMHEKSPDYQDLLAFTADAKNNDYVVDAIFKLYEQEMDKLITNGQLRYNLGNINFDLQKLTQTPDKLTARENAQRKLILYIQYLRQYPDYAVNFFSSGLFCPNK